MSKFIVFILIFSSLSLISTSIDEPNSISPTIERNIIFDLSAPQSTFSPSFSSQRIPENVYEKMLGNSIPIKDKSKVNIDNLSYLHISYFGFNGKTHTGEIIVNSKLADEVLEIFRELYSIQYPIEKIKLIDEYGANDELSMADNNTSCFCYRTISGTNSLSNHSTGCAIDINPLYNPYVSKKSISPVSGTIYANRNSNFKHQIKKNDTIYNIFISKGWSWGGDWDYPKDYQHFEKNI